MKKIIISALFAVLATASFASATTTWTNDGTPPTPAVTGTLAGGVIGQTTFQVSTKVKLIADGNAGGYNCTSKHEQGDRNFISSSVSATIEETVGVKGVALAALILSPTVANQYTGTAGY